MLITALITRFKRLLIGRPLRGRHGIHGFDESGLPKWKALPVFSSDAFSSVAYATEEILLVLSAVSGAALVYSLPVAFSIAGLLVILTFSYRKVLQEYPSGGAAYLVASENLGTGAALLAASALLLDYIMTVAVSVSASVAALASALPSLSAHRPAVALMLLALITVLNLRGIRESTAWLTIPAYLFITSIATLVGFGLYEIAKGRFLPVAAPAVGVAAEGVTIFLLIRAFASGCAALTGIETIASRVGSFRPPVVRNAKMTLTVASFVLCGLFLGVTYLARYHGVLPENDQTVLSSLAHVLFENQWPYFVVQFSTALILLFAANHAYASFPLLASMLAKDRFLPRQLASVGDRLVFSNAIVGLAMVAAALVVFFGASVHRLIPLYAVGVFLSFTLSQAGMVVHVYRRGVEGWWKPLLVCGFGALTTFCVLIVIAVGKFSQGAWVVMLLIPALVLLFTRIKRHYVAVGRELSLDGMEAPPNLQKLKHTVIVPVSGIHRGVIDALRYAVSISDDVRACYIELDPSKTEDVQREWNRWAHEIPFVILKSPYRSVIQPLIEYVNDVEEINHDDLVTVIIPEFVTARWSQRVLHNQTAWMIRTALAFRRNKVVTSVRYHLKT